MVLEPVYPYYFNRLIFPQSENAMYTVTLIDTSTNEYNTAFQVIPSRGYQEYSFSLSIINSALLDYEDDNWRQFSFTMFVEETADPTHTDQLQINVELINWNDEAPIFTKDEYVADILETIGVDEIVATVEANDRDIGDTVE